LAGPTPARAKEHDSEVRDEQRADRQGCREPKHPIRLWTIGDMSTAGVVRLDPPPARFARVEEHVDHLAGPDAVVPAVTHRADRVDDLAWIA
jgi:hypothetical protein